MTIIPGAIAAFLIAAVYLMFLREMDIFEKEKKRFSIMCFILGALFTFLLIPLQMKFPIMEWLPSSGDFLTRFKFHFFAVAFFEEFVKILPFIIMLRLPKVMDESFDYIKYASVGALGFATVENVLYFSRSLHIIEGRAFYTAVLHMFTSSVIAYSIYYARVKKGKSIITSFALSYVLAVALHALYNALISESETHILGVAFVGVILIVWGRMMNNLLNDSSFYNEVTIQNKVVLAGTKLLVGWALVFFYACFAIVATENPKVGFEFFKEGLLFGIFTGLGLFITLARPILKKGHWFPLLSGKRRK